MVVLGSVCLPWTVLRGTVITFLYSAFLACCPHGTSHISSLSSFVLLSVCGRIVPFDLMYRDRPQPVKENLVVEKRRQDKSPSEGHVEKRPLVNGEATGQCL